jgi:hypothetical protein
VPSTNSTTLRPYLSAGFPFPGALVAAADPPVSFTIANAETTVVPGTIQLFLNGSNVTSGLNLSNNAAGTVVSYQPASMAPLNSTNTLRAVFSDGTVSLTNEWQFAVSGAPDIISSGATFGATDPVSGTAPVTFNATVNPHRLDSTVVFQFGLNTSYGGSSATILMGAAPGASAVSTVVSGFVPGLTYHYRAVATNVSGTTLGPDQTFTGPAGLPGDSNHDGYVDQAELDAVLTNYWPYSPWLYMTNTAGLGSTHVTFALSNSTAGAYSVEYSTNLTNWLLLGPATPRYEFLDPNATNAPQRYYRLRWP